MTSVAIRGLVLVLALVALLPSPAMAEVSPFGFTIGSASHADVRKGLAATTKVEDAGTNKFSNGPMLRADGAGLGFEGLQSALFIFNEKKILIGVLLTLRKHRFDAVTGHLDGKYRSVRRQIPFVGDKSVSYRDDDVTIEAEAPHLSFEMTLSYINDELMRQFKSQSAAEEQQKRKREGSKL
jgi:hypothetical protein